MVDTYSNLIDLGDAVETGEQELRHVSASLSAITHLMLSYVRCGNMHLLALNQPHRKCTIRQFTIFPRIGDNLLGAQENSWARNTSRIDAFRNLCASNY